MQNKIQLFEGNHVRSRWDEDREEWFFSVIDVCAALTQTATPRRYWSDLKRKLKKEGAEQVYENIVQLKMESPDGRMRTTDAANMPQLFRIIQSIPSPKAEPFKRWLAQVGTERIEETIDPEIAIQRAKETYLRKGYDQAWIDQRLLSIRVRNELTDEWKKHGVEKGQDYARLTDIIHKEAFDVTVRQHKNIKGMKKGNLRDNMTTLEMVLSMLGEATTTELERDKNPKSMHEHIKVAKAGGSVAKNARLDIERRTGNKVVSSKNAVDLIEEQKKISK